MSDWKTDVRNRLSVAGIEDPDREAARITALAEAEGGDVSARAMAMVERRVAGAPLEYVLGRATFMGVEMLADEGALVPREETEILGRGSERRIRALGVEGELRIIDMCCGAGNLACALAKIFPNARVWASDLTDGCVNLTRRNVEFLGLSDRVSVHQGDLFAGLADLGLEGTIDALVCNPPYISTGRLDKDRAALLEHEPVEAFDGGPYGLTIHQRVIKEGDTFLRPGGLLSFEFGLGQERQIQLLFRRAKQYDGVEFDSDADGHPRAAFTRKKGD
jgi:release factor glutamine methyltransferase